MTTQDPLEPSELGLVPSRDYDEALAQLSYLAAPRTPPAALKARVMDLIEPRPTVRASLGRWAALTAALAAVLLAPSLLRPPAEGRLVSARGATINGRPAASGSPVRAGQRVSVGEGGEAIVRVGDGRAAFRLLHGGAAAFSNAGDGYIVTLESGWMLSAVKTGVPYLAATPHGTAMALGTEYLLKVQPDRSWVCICRGSLRLGGDFPETVISSHPHGPFEFRAGHAPVPPAVVTMEAHLDADLDALAKLIQ